MVSQLSFDVMLKGVIKRLVQYKVCHLWDAAPKTQILRTSSSFI